MNLIDLSNIVDPAINGDLSKRDDILKLWRNRRWIDSPQERKRVDFLCRFTLRVLERHFPGYVWPYLTQEESDLIDQAENDCHKYG